MYSKLVHLLVDAINSLEKTNYFENIFLGRYIFRLCFIIEP